MRKTFVFFGTLMCIFCAIDETGISKILDNRCEVRRHHDRELMDLS